MFRRVAYFVLRYILKRNTVMSAVLQKFFQVLIGLLDFLVNLFVPRIHTYITCVKFTRHIVLIAALIVENWL